jgi:thioredoxin-like negative regulator of GroEL
MTDAREADALRLLAHQFMNTGRFAQARDLLAGLSHSLPDDAFALRNLVCARLHLGEYAEAEPLAARLAAGAEGKDRAPALFFHAHALWGCGRTDECRAVVDNYIGELQKS